VALYLVGCAAAGFGITYLFGIAFNLEERVVFGTVLGAAAVAGISFAPALLARDVTVVTVLLGLAAALAIGGASLFAARDQVADDWRAARGRWLAPVRGEHHPWPLLAVVLVCGVWTVHFFHQAYVYTPVGLFAGFVNIWGDWAAHLTFAGSFAYGHNFPPEYPIDPGHRLGYPFMADFLSADMVPLGLSLTEALTATSAMLALAFPGVMYLAALRFTAGRGAAVIAVFVFLLSGGLGFVYLLGDLHRYGLAALWNLPSTYTQRYEANLQWLNPVLAYMIPQRSTLFGFSLTLILVLVLWLAVRESLGWRPFLVAGVAAGVMPAFHVHGYGTVVALPAVWAIFNRRREWAAFFVPALVLGVPILAWMWPPDNTSMCGDLPTIARFCIQPGWLAFGDVQRHGIWTFFPDVLWFWIWNTSLLLPLVAAGHLLVRWFPTRFPTWFAPMWLWFIVPSFVVLQPWVWDNTKFFIFWALLGSVVVGGVLAGMIRFHRATAAMAALAIVLLMLSGFLDLARASNFRVSAVMFTDSGGLRVADWVRSNTSPTALFVVADEHNSPIPSLAGRRVLLGYPAWLWTYGLADYVQKGEDDKRILQGDPATPGLVRKYGVDYVMIGPQEVNLGASLAYWDVHGVKVYDDGEYAVYRVKIDLRDA
jgi:hypothetical protein